MASNSRGSPVPRLTAVPAGDGRRRRDVAGLVWPGVATAVDDPLDEGMPRLAVGGDGGGADGAVLVGLVVRLLEDGGPGAPGLGDAPVDVGHLECDVDDAVAVPTVVVGVGAVGMDGAADDEPDRPRLEDVRLVVPEAGLRPAVGDQLHTPRRLVVVRGLGGVADHEDDGVPAGHREDVLLLVVLDQPDELLQLVDVEPGVALLLGQVR